MAQTRTFNTMMAILFKHFITFKCKYVRKDTQIPYNIFTKHRFIPSQIYIYPLTNPFKLLFCNILIISALPPPTQNIHFNPHYNFFPVRVHILAVRDKICLKNCNFAQIFSTLYP